MKLGRRNFGKAIAGTVLSWAFLAGIGSVTFLTGCSAETVAAAIIASFNQVLALLQASGIVTNSGLVTAVTAALKAFSDAFDAYEASKSQGTLQALGQAAEKALTDVQAFLAATDLGGPLAQVAASLLQIIIATLISFLPTPAPTILKLKAAGVTISVTAVPKPPLWKTNAKKARKTYVSEFNAGAVAVGHPELQIK